MEFYNNNRFMRRRLISFLLLILCSAAGTKAQEAEKPTFRLYLIGDAGEDDTTESTLLDLKQKLLEDTNSAVIFLGDNCYRNAMYGLLPFEVKGYDGSKIAKARVMSQLSILKNYQGSAYFIPGNHDWWNYTNLRYGKRALALEEQFIEKYLRDSSKVKNGANTFLPDNGSFGPEFREFNNNKTRVIFLDSYRLILEEGSSRQDSTLLKLFYSNLQRMLREGTAKHQKIVVVAHHPIHAKGKHSIPLAAWETLVRRLADANTNYPPYNKMATHLDSLLKEQHHPDIYYVAGHEHSLEYFFNDSLHYLVSGAGSKVDSVDYKETVKENEYFIWNQEGFFEIEFYGRYERVLMYHRKNPKAPIEVHCVAGCG